MTRIGTGLAAIAAAVLMLGATPANACGKDEQGHACSCHKDGAKHAKAKAAEGKDAKATASTAEKAAEPAPAKAAEPTKAATPAPAADAPQSCVLRPAGDELAGKCSCGGPSDCTCKKNDCQCAKCSKRHAGNEAQRI
jgi:hypothetical protein